MLKLATLFGLLVTASGCSPADDNQPVPSKTIAAENLATTPNDSGALQPAKPGEPGGLADDGSTLGEGAIDLKSAQGAAQIVQRYFALLEEGATERANALWSEGRPSLEFDSQRARFSELRANIGRPGEIEGAAGSLYVEVPIQLYGRLRGGEQSSAFGTMTLRRANDVPGTSSRQREWHIYKSTFLR